MARRLLFILLIPLLGLIGFAARIFVDRQDDLDHLERADAALALSSDLGDLLSAVDDEVVQLAALIVAEPADESLAGAQKEADRALEAAWTSYRAIEAILDPEVSSGVAAALADSQGLLDGRVPAGDGAITVEEAIARYQPIVAEVDAALVRVIAGPALRRVTSPMIAYNTILDVRSGASVEQALILQALEAGEWESEPHEAAMLAADAETVRLQLVHQMPLAADTIDLGPPRGLIAVRDHVDARGGSAVPELTIPEWRQLSDSWRTQLDQGADQQSAAAARAIAADRRQATGTMRATVLVGSAVVIASLAAALGGSYLYLRRVLRLKRHMVDVADGNLDRAPIGDSRRDEVAVIAKAFDDMTEAVRRAVAAETAEADILEHIARGGDVSTALTMIADLATRQTGVEHAIVTEDPLLPAAEPIRLHDDDGEPTAWLVRVGAEPLTGPRPPVIGSCVGLALLALERDRTDQTLTYQATHDTLTGLANRAVILRETERALRRPGGGRTAVLYCDLDGFKAVNDAHGHRAGDRVLVEVATRLRSVIGSSGLLARVGGDEFVALLPEVSAVESVTLVADAVLETMAEPFLQEPLSMSLSVSVGIAVAGSAARAEDLLRDADLALYRAKAAGRARWELFDDDLGQWAAHRVETANALRTALDEDQIELWYQPVFGISGGLVGFEGLVRWNRPGHGIVSPADFLSVAEETGMIIPLGDRVLRDGCRQLAQWSTNVPTVATVLSLNMSGAQLTHPDFASRVAAALREANASPKRLQVEITESVLLENRVEAASTLAILRRNGVRVAIDDFGTGYSSLAYLRELPVDLLKVDRAFVSHIEESTEDQAIVRAVITLAEALDMVVIAEGVERPEQLRELKRLGCRYVQGFLMGRPMTAFAATKLLEDQAAATAAGPVGAARG
ncbi:MAG: EAL domain-containing protein [Acidimicrobiia bacterium]|nr:EAL domain-containing protein [Acidimicrobiia bacterium]